jgi:M6 family metalloprotease-like protein
MLQRRHLLVCFSLVTALSVGFAAADSATQLGAATQPATTQPAAAPEKLDGFATVQSAITTELQRATPALPQVGYLGIDAGPNDDGNLVVRHLDPGSPAATAGFKDGDVITRVGGDAHPQLEPFRQWLLNQTPGAKLTLTVKRDGREIELSPVVAPASRPMKLAGQRAVMGVQLADAPQGSEGALIDRVSPDMPADRAGVQPGDVVVELDGVPVTARQSLTDALQNHAPNDEIKLGVKRDGKHVELRVKLVADRNPNPIFGGVERTPAYFKKSVYRLAVVGVEFPDHKHNTDISTNDWEQSLFSKKSYSQTATGQTAYGSLYDYYQEISAGNLRVEGKMFDWVEVAKNRSEYAQATGDTQKMLPEALGKLLDREGKDALNGFDGIAFIYAGDRVATNRGGLFWPHKGMVPFNGARWDYLIAGEGGPKMTNISVFCHEFGHMLGLPDLYARPENPGSEGLGVWCLMSNQLPNGRPQHMSAWCKEQLGWLKPAVIDPTVQQKLVLSPVESSSRECYKVLIRANGSEYLLLEDRRKTGFDTDLPGEGLLVWHVTNNRPFLVESHGISGPVGPRAYPQDVPFPSSANHALTPYTTPSSRSQLGGGLPVFISEIQRRPDGRITFAVGYVYF